MAFLPIVAFAVTYLGMALGRLPGLRIDRTGIALCAAVVLIAAGAVSPQQAWQAIDVPTLLTLFALMILSAQCAEAGLYRWCAARLAAADLPESALLAAVVVVAGVLAAIVSNDVVVFAMTPMLCQGMQARGRSPLPFVLALAAAANAGSAATAIGNPQNILIAQSGSIGFASFLAVGAVPSCLSLLVCWWGLRRRLGESVPGRRGSEEAEDSSPVVLQTAMAVKAAFAAGAMGLVLTLFPAGETATAGLMAIAALLLVSRQLSSRRALEMVDWHLLVLFAALFIVTDAFAATGAAGQMLTQLATWGLSIQNEIPLLIVSVVGSNTIGNVPADMMLLATVPNWQTDSLLRLAVYSTLAGNLLLTGSMANVIASEQAARAGVDVSFASHARSGIPITIGSLLLALGWFVLISA